jgi:hypothetical protein
MRQPTGDLTTDLGHAIVESPKYVATWLLGMFYAILTDSAVQTFIVTGVLAGLVADSILVGCLVFFVLHSLATMLRLSLSGAASLVGNNVASVMIQRMQREDLAMAQGTQPAFEDEQPPS